MPTVLVIDDDPQFRDILQSAFADAGYNVLMAQNGRHGVALYAANAVDLVVTDILMPEQEGIETIIRIRKGDRNARVLAISGGGRTGNMQFLEAATKFGASAVLAKPFRLEQLLKAAAVALGEAAPISRKAEALERPEPRTE